MNLFKVVMGNLNAKSFHYLGDNPLPEDRSVLDRLSQTLLVNVNPLFENLTPIVSTENHNIYLLLKSDRHIAYLQQIEQYWTIYIIDKSLTLSEMNSIMCSLSIGILTLNPFWEVEYVNPHMSTMTGLNVEEMLARKWLKIFDEEIHSSISDHFGREGQNPLPLEATFDYVSPLGRRKLFKLMVSSSVNSDLIVTGYTMVVSDITNEEQSRQRLIYLAKHDPLTSLLNRAGFVEMLTGLPLQKLENSVLAFIDVNDFKEVNDTKGHAAGDELLEIISQRIKRSTKETDIVARLGGDEFVVLALDVMTKSDIVGFGKKLLKILTGAITLKKGTVNTSCSIGVARSTDILKDLTGDRSDFIQTFINAADTAMYMAKNDKMSNLYFFDNELKKMQLQWRARQQEYEHIMENELYTFHFQPIFRSGVLYSIEALIRPVGLKYNEGIDDFFTCLNRSQRQLDHFNKITKSTIELLRAKIVSIPSLIDTCININLDVIQLISPDFVSNFHQWIIDAQLKPENIYVEITETALESDEDTMEVVLNDIKSRAFKVSMDDFGTGYSSLKRLINYEFDQLKLDRFFIENLGESAKFRKSLNAIISLGKGLDIELLAEGVETEQQAKFLKEAGVPLFQGYYFAKPQELNELIPLLEKTENNYA